MDATLVAKKEEFTLKNIQMLKELLEYQQKSY